MLMLKTGCVLRREFPLVLPMRVKRFLACDASFICNVPSAPIVNIQLLSIAPGLPIIRRLDFPQLALLMNIHYFPIVGYS